MDIKAHMVEDANQNQSHEAEVVTKQIGEAKYMIYPRRELEPKMDTDYEENMYSHEDVSLV